MTTYMKRLVGLWFELKDYENVSRVSPCEGDSSSLTNFGTAIMIIVIA